jgi:hypothetical protein
VAARSLRQHLGDVALTAVGGALSARLLPRRPTRRRLLRRVVLGTLLTWGAREAMRPERQDALRVQWAEQLRADRPAVHADLRDRLGRDPTDEELIAFAEWEAR